MAARKDPRPAPKQVRLLARLPGKIIMQAHGDGWAIAAIVLGLVLLLLLWNGLH